jgi:putative aldouronate transport system permease protein
MQELNLKSKTDPSVRLQPPPRKTAKGKHIKENIELYLIMAPVIVLIIVFCYVPIYGIVIAFQDYVPGVPFFGPDVKWVGLKYFKEFVTSFYFMRILKNTLVLSGMNLLMGFWIPIIFALVLNEVRFPFFRKTIQTISYMPYFVSMVVVVGIVLSFIANDGMIVKLLGYFGVNVAGLNVSKSAFPWVYTLTNIWKSFGWGSILYLSTISSIDPELYESAEMDGAGRLRRIWHITLPHMVPLIAIQLIFAIGGILGSNTEMILLLYNPAVYSTADVIGTYVYRDGLLGGRFSYGTAVGLLMSVIGFALVYITNKISRKLTDFSLW